MSFTSVHRNRVIYQSQALYMAPSSTGYHLQTGGGAEGGGARGAAAGAGGQGGGVGGG